MPVQNLKKKLRDACERGAWVDLGDEEDQVIDARDVKDALTAKHSGSLHPIRIKHAVIDGHLDLHCCTIASPVRLEDCEFKHPINLSEASGSSVHLSRCSAPALSATQLSLRGDLMLVESEFSEGIDLANAHIGGRLGLDGVTLRAKGGPALDAEGIRVEKGVSLKETSKTLVEVDGALLFLRARIGGLLAIVGAKLNGRGEATLNAGDIRIEGSFHCARLDAIGELNFVGGYVRGQFTIKGATLNNKKGRSLNCDGMDVGQDFFLESAGNRPFVAEGTVNLAGAHVGGQLAFENARFSDSGNYALNAEGVKVDQDMFCGANRGCSLKITGGLNVAGARIGGQMAVRGACIEAGDEEALMADGLEVAGAFVVRGAKDGPAQLKGEISLMGADLRGFMSVENCRFEHQGGTALVGNRTRIGGDFFWRRSVVTGRMALVGVQIQGKLSFDRVTLNNEGETALDADGIRVDQGIKLYGDKSEPAVINGEVSLVNGRVRGEVRFQNAVLHNRGANTLVAERLSIDGNFFFSESSAIGDMRMTGARITGQAIFEGASLVCERRSALNADNLTVDQDVFIRAANGMPFEAIGEVRLNNAHIGGALRVLGGSFRAKGASGRALNIEGVEVARGVTCRSMTQNAVTVKGEICLAGAHVQEDLDFEEIELDNDGRVALSASGLRVDADAKITGTALGGMVFERAEVKGRFHCLVGLGDGAVAIDFSESTMGTMKVRFRDGDPVLDMRRMTTGVLHRLDVKGKGWPKAHLEGFQYTTLTPADLTTKDVDARLHWIAADPNGYSSQPYEQLREIYKRTGFDGGARRVGIFSQKQRRRYLGRAEKAGNRILGATVAHGYRPSQALLWLIGLLAVGWLLFGCVFSAGKAGSDADLTSLKPAKEQVSLQPVAYTTDLLLPGVGLGQQSAWDAHGAAQWSGLALTCVGWLLTAAVIAGVSVRRQ